MKKILMIFLILIFSVTFCGCFDEPLYDVNYPKPVIVEPDEDTAYTVNGYKDTTVTTSSDFSETASSVSSNNSSTQYNGRYIGNKNSKKLHTTNCSYAKKLKEENIVIFETVNDAQAQGYECCSKCLD